MSLEIRDRYVTNKTDGKEEGGTRPLTERGLLREEGENPVL